MCALGWPQWGLVAGGNKKTSLGPAGAQSALGFGPRGSLGPAVPPFSCSVRSCCWINGL